MAARVVRPVYSTSSTSTTDLSVIGISISRFLHYGLGVERGKIVAIEGNVERAEQYWFLFDALNNFRQPLRQRNSAPPDADQRQIFDAIVFLENLMRQPDQSALHLGCRHELRFLVDLDRTPWRA